MKLDIIGDIHGCYEELTTLIEKLGYTWAGEIPVHPERQLAFIGDLTDRGPRSLDTIDLVAALCSQGKARYVPGNHCDKLYRYFLGHDVQIRHGLETTVAEWASSSPSKQEAIKKKFLALYEDAPLYDVLDGGRLILAHAGMKEEWIGRKNKKIRTFVLYGDITGERNPDGTPVRRDWARDYHGDAWIVYGHTPVPEPRMIHRTVNIDTGAVFGGRLTAFRYPELETVSVPSTMPSIPTKFTCY
ncbi:bis(5'-nucleosyl)-tetraphosphatase PrpE [Rossellomorea marisflavi]|uniref:bis(5'-nucleosyl)-tetraphosphatase PrpE n=1 Tax=Rossellomorea marisflavi TaxID=189381 RepID=UPI00064FE678|nr:bis(5'-nucleosyl)-tetraphosphatase PrpE [Rossellomorea marisflavi]KML32579.1 bis(5'-nucleosyl)-tetraphosphatase [Rossellomorea marisflavi]MCM2603775.1 bis(5'-nucleosyl)-tetraphosphatase PrpE [Rossellomorea marisflavi]QHA35895.1 bis(5'-nucleosyl)-tetraphosphatase PrpE [Rossellomorea marisflavi]